MVIFFDEMNQRSSRKGGRNPKHLRNNKSYGNSNSSNWREHKSNGSNESPSYGYNNHPLTSAFIMLVGLEVQIQKLDGDIYEGILETVSPQVQISLSHATKIGGPTANGVNEPACEKIVFPFCDVLYCKASNVDLEYGKRDSLQIDSEISRNTGPSVNRELVQWKGDTPDGVAELLESIEMNGSFDVDEMLRVNEEKHGVKSTYDITMSDYMTPIEKSNPELYREQERRAEKVAREMQTDPSYKELDNVDSGYNEEEMFSSVTRTPIPVTTPNSPNPHPTVKNNTNSHLTSNTSHMNSNNINNNDGFTTYSSRKSSRGAKSQEQSVGPRFRNRPPSQDSSSSPHHTPVNRSYSSGSSHRVYNNNPRSNAYQSQQHVVSNSIHPTHTVDNQIMSTNHSKLDQSVSVGSLTYSAVMKKPNHLNQKGYPTSNNNNINSVPKHSPTGQPLVNQNYEKHKSASPINHAQYSPNRTTVVHPEALAAAKAEMIQNSRDASKSQYPSVSTIQSESTNNYPSTQPIQKTIPNNSQPSSNNSQSIPNNSQNTPNISQSVPISSRQPVVAASSTTTIQPAVAKEIHDKKTLEQKMDTPVDGLSKFGKIIHHEEEQKSSSISQLKEFSETFKLSDSATKITKKTPPKTVEVPNRPRAAGENEKESITKELNEETKGHQEDTSPSKSVPSTISPPVSDVKTSTVDVTSTASAVTVVSTAFTTTTESNTVSRESQSNQSSKKSVLQPDAKLLNPTAKEFTPSFAQKSHISKQTSYPGTQSQPQVQTPIVSYQHQQSQYYNMHPFSGAPVFVNTPPEMIPAQQTPQMHVGKYYPRPTTAVFSITAGDFTQNPNGQPQVIGATQSGFIPHQNVTSHQGQQIYLVHGPNGPMQQIIPQGQQVFPVQPVHQTPVIRYVSHPGPPHMQHQTNRGPPNFPQQDAPSYVIVSQHGSAASHQAMQTNNQAHNYPALSPSPSPHMNSGTPQPFGINQPHPQSAYPQMTSPVTHNQGNIYPRPPTPLSSQQHHVPTQQQQQPFVMMAATGGVHHSGHNLQGIQMAPNNQPIMHGQHPGGILQPYQQQGN